MGLFSKPKAPPPLDVAAVTAASQKANLTSAQQSANLNRPNQTGPFGQQIQYAQTGKDANGNPIYSATSTLGDVGQKYATGLTGLGSQYMDLAHNYNPTNMSMDAFGKAQDLYDSTQAPIIQRQNDQLDTKLKTQGLVPGTEAYDNAMKDQLFSQAQGRNAFIANTQGQMFNQGLQGTQEQANLYGPGVQFGNNAMAQPNIPVPGVNVGNTDVAGIMQNSQDDAWKAYNAQVAQQNGMYGALGQIGSLALAPMTGGLSLAALGASGFGGAGSIIGGANDGVPRPWNRPS